MKVKNSFLSILISLIFLSVNSQFLKAESYSSQQMIPAGHWVYDAFQLPSNSIALSKSLIASSYSPKKNSVKPLE